MDVLTVLTGAAVLGGGFPPEVEDTPANRDLFAQIKAEVDAAPPGAVIDIPAEPAEWDADPKARGGP